MPSVVHEALVDLFRARPHLAAELLVAVKAAPSAEDVEGALLDSDLSQAVAPEYRADAAVRLRGGLELLLIIEIQLRKDGMKRRVWPAYVGVAHARHGCGVAVMVVTLDRETARWAAEPIEVGPGFVLRPIVIGPDQVPVVTAIDDAMRSPEIAVLSAMAHGYGPEGAQVGIAAAEAARGLDEERARLYLDLVLEFLNPAARILLERLMIENWQPQSDFMKRLDARARAEGLAEGRAEGLAQGLARGGVDGQRHLLARQLRKRFGALPAEIEDRVAQATQPELERWAEDLLVADSLDALFGGAR